MEILDILREECVHSRQNLAFFIYLCKYMVFFRLSITV